MSARMIVAVLTAFASAGSAIDSRQPAPEFTAKSLDGEKFTNQSLKGKVVLLQFWTTWCRYCRADQEGIDSLARRFEGKGLVVLAVNVGESKKTVRQYLEKSPRASRIVLTEDTNLAARFPASGFPLYVAIDGNGKIAGQQEGAGGEEALRKLLMRAGLETE